MTRRVRRAELLGAAVVAALGLALAAVALGHSSGSVPAHPTSSARPAALAFGRSYLAYLSASGSAGALSDATAHVRTLAAAGGVLPAGDRTRPLRLSSVKLVAVTGAPQGNAVIAATNGEVSLKVAVGLVYLDGHWSVDSLVPPDLDTLLVRAPAVGVPAALRRAAGRFVVSYADYRERAGRRPALQSPAAQQLAARSDPLARVPASGSPATLQSLEIVPQRTLASVSATLTDHGRRLHLAVVMKRSGGSWRAWDFPQRDS